MKESIARLPSIELQKDIRLIITEGTLSLFGLSTCKPCAKTREVNRQDFPFSGFM
jgi:hypothetical protein